MWPLTGCTSSTASDCVLNSRIVATLSLVNRTVGNQQIDSGRMGRFLTCRCFPQYICATGIGKTCWASERRPAYHGPNDRDVPGLNEPTPAGQADRVHTIKNQFPFAKPCPSEVPQHPSTPV